MALAGHERRKTVLVVDDKTMVREAVTLLLGIGGFEVIAEVEDGIGAISLSQALRPDFVILDYAMPKVNGKTAAEAIRMACPDVSIIVFSAELESAPPWGDAFVRKDSFDELLPLLRAMSDLEEPSALVPFEG